LSVRPGFLSFSTPASMPEPRPEVELGVGPGGGLVRVPETPGLEERRGYRAALVEDVLEASPDAAVQLHVVVVGVVPGAFADRVDVEVVLEGGADAGQVVDDVHADGAQVVGRPDAGLQEELGRADAARGDQDLAIAADSPGRQPLLLDDLHAYGAPTLHDDSRDEGPPS
jgi:hypothetical protein